MRLIAVACCVVWAAAAPVARADQLADIRHKGEFTCGVLATDEPMSFVDPQTRTIIGYEVDLCRAVARKIGVTATVKQIAVSARIPDDNDVDDEERHTVHDDVRGHADDELLRHGHESDDELRHADDPHVRHDADDGLHPLRVGFDTARLAAMAAGGVNS